MPEFLKSLTSMVAVGFGVGFLIFMHELGHFLLAKWSKVRVEAFSLGFGPALWKFVRGDTEYRLSVIPLGGYVKMAGENPGEDRKGGGDELHSKPALNRFLIFAAGSFMNLTIAFPLCAAAYMIGLNETAPIIGSIAPSSAEWASDLQVGDTILEVDGNAVRSLKDYQMDVMLRDPKVEVPVLVDRGGQKVKVMLRPMGPEGYGVGPVLRPEVAMVEKDSPAAEGDLRVGDRILAVGGVEVETWEPVAARIRESGGKPLTLEIERETDAAKSTLELTVTPRAEDQWVLDPSDLVSPSIEDAKRGSPAFRFGDALQRGDRILSVTPAGAARIDVRTWGEFQRAIESLGGREVTIHVRRGEAETDVRALVQQAKGGSGLVGVSRGDTKLVDLVPAGSPFAAAGVQPGDELISAGDDEIAGWFALSTQIAISGKPDAIPLKVKRAGQEVALTITPMLVSRGKLGILPKPLTVLHKYGFGESLQYGAIQVWRCVDSTLETLKGLILGRVSAKNLAGPVGIFSMSYKVAERQLTELLWFLAFISVNLAVVNMMPIPILDGGHILFLLVEAVRGRPVSENVLIASQYVGLVMILSLIVWVTFFDILRTIG